VGAAGRQDISDWRRRRCGLEGGMGDGRRPK
jgi:hypothetical protein